MGKLEWIVLCGKYGKGLEEGKGKNQLKKQLLILTLNLTLNSMI
jgi:hypothetical protein